MASVWLEIEGAKAKARMLATQNNNAAKEVAEVEPGSTSANNAKEVAAMDPGSIAATDTGATRDIVAAKSGFSSGKTFERANNVVQAIDNAPAPVADALRVVVYILLAKHV